MPVLLSNIYMPVRLGLNVHRARIVGKMRTFSIIVFDLSGVIKYMKIKVHFNPNYSGRCAKMHTLFGIIF